MKEGPGSNSHAEALEARASLSLSLTIHEMGKSPHRLRPRRSLAAVAQGSWDTVYPYCSHFAYLTFDSRNTITQPVSDKTFLRTVSYTFTTTLKDFCSQILKSDVKPGFPKTIKTNNPDVLRAARHSAESFNNCSNDAFLFRESRISRALVQIVKGLKFMLDIDIGRTTCRKNGHANLDDCGFQTNRTLQWTLSCYSEVWVIPWLQTTKVSILHCH